MLRYQSCLSGLLAELVAGASDDALQLKVLRESPTILNLHAMARFPDEILMLDSEWFRLHFGNDIDGLLCRPDAQYAPLFEKLGVRTLTSVAKIELDFSDGLEEKEETFEVLLRDRTDCILRLLHDKASTVRTLVEAKLRAISVRSFDQVKIRASIELDALFVSESRPVAAFYDAAENRLIFARHQSGRTWPQAFNAMLHRFLTNESGADVARLSAVCWSLVDKATLEDAHPSMGFLCVEVKGGGIGFDSASGEWYSVDRKGETHAIKDPARQALGAKFSILKKLGESQRWRDLRIGKVVCGHSVFFPDLASGRDVSRPNLPIDLIGCAGDLPEIRRWVEHAFDYWRNQDKSQSAMGPKGLRVFRDVFGRSFEVRPLLAKALQAEEVERIRLTQEQARILDILRARRRVAISGGAGTGKTLLAVEKARRLANEDFRTLLTCYNRPLADHLATVCAGVPGLDVMSFHQLCYRRTEEAMKVSGRDLLQEAKKTYPGADLYTAQYPCALSYSLDILNDRYDAIVCDEGQDFADDFWVPLEMLLADYEKSPFYIFFDDNQDIYARVGSFPIQDAPYPLTVNCRNTRHIHEAAYRYYRGIPVAPPGIVGEEIHVIEAKTFRAQGDKLHARLVELINKERIPAGDISVLVAEAQHKTDFYEILRHRPLPAPANWLVESVRGPYTVLLETVNRFKGLEAPVVFLWGLDGIDVAAQRESLYVGMSRAKSMLFVVGSTDKCNAVLRQNLIPNGSH
jgi:hypothetical protein